MFRCQFLQSRRFLLYSTERVLVCARIADSAQAQGQVTPSAAPKRVTLVQDRGDFSGLRSCADQHMGETRMDRQPRDAFAVFCDALIGGERAELLQKQLRLCQKCGGWGRQKRQVFKRCAPKRELERKARQISGFNFSGRKGGQGAVFRLCPKFIGCPFGHTPSTPCALRGLRARGAFCHKPRHARARIKARAPRQPAVHDDANILNR